MPRLSRGRQAVLASGAWQMVRFTIGVSLLSAAAVLSGAPRFEKSVGVPMQGVLDTPVLAKYRSKILGQKRELIVHLPRGYDRSDCM